jgi:uncharacterized RDD family membrane protein YckC
MSEQNPYAPPEADVEVFTRTDNELASRWARFGGALVDGLIMAAIIWGAVFAFGFWERMAAGEQSLQQTAILGLLGFGSFLLINGYLLATRGQTVGKVVAGTRIVSVSDGKIIPLWKIVFLRLLPIWVINYVPIIGSFFGLADSLFVFRKDRRCIHDWIAGTKVVVATESY